MRWLSRVLLVLAVVMTVVALGLTLPNLDEYEVGPGEPPETSPAIQRVADAPTLDPSPTVGQSAQVQPRSPQRLRMWHFDAPVVPLLLTGDTLVPPDDPQVLGWWGQQAGSRRGVTLLTGHTVHSGGGMFDDLEDVPIGSVADLSGVRYVVTSVRVLSKEAVAQEATDLFSQVGKPRLVLVTCEDYDTATGEYASNVVVIAEPA